MLLGDQEVTPDFREQLIAALRDPEVVNILHQYSDYDTIPDGLHHQLGLRHDQSSYGDHKHNGTDSGILDVPWVMVASAGQHLNIATATILAWANGILFGSTAWKNSMWTSGDNTKIVAPVAGAYYVGANVWTTNQNDPGKSATRIRYIIKVNGVIKGESSSFIQAQNGACPAGSPHWIVPCNANDYLQITGEGIDSALDINTGDFQNVDFHAALISRL